MYISVKDAKNGRIIMIDGVACKVVEVEMSAPGKHGSAKARITGIGIFDGQKKTLLKPSGSDLESPVTTKTRAQVVSTVGDNAQLMDLDTYETYELQIPDSVKSSLKPSSEVEVLECMGKKVILRIVG
jgi:translation initiation factor 5A